MHGLHSFQVGLDKALAFARPLIHTTRTFALKSYAYIIKIDVLYLARHVATYKAAVLAGAGNVIEVDTTHLAATTLNLSLGESPVGILMIAVGTWIAGHVDRLGLSPPHIAPQAAVQLDVREYHIGNGSLVAILDAQTTVRTCDNAVIKHHVIDRVHILATNLDGARTARHHTVGNSNIVARAILFELATVLQADAVVATGDMAVSNTHMLRMVDIDTIAIADFQVVQQINAINHSFIATNQMNSPVSALLSALRH